MLNHLFMEEGPVSFKLANIQRWPCLLMSVIFTLHKINLFIGERMIILHAGTMRDSYPTLKLCSGLLRSSSGDYQGERNHKMIVRWLEDKLIPYLSPKCALVMDKAAYHNVQVDRHSDRATKKHLIQEWLTRHGIK